MRVVPAGDPVRRAGGDVGTQDVVIAAGDEHELRRWGPPPATSMKDGWDVQIPGLEEKYLMYRSSWARVMIVDKTRFSPRTILTGCPGKPHGRLPRPRPARLMQK
jgi:hypothetical protein